MTDGLAFILWRVSKGQCNNNPFDNKMLWPYSVTCTQISPKVDDKGEKIKIKFYRFPINFL